MSIEKPGYLASHFYYFIYINTLVDINSDYAP